VNWTDSHDGATVESVLGIVLPLLLRGLESRTPNTRPKSGEAFPIPRRSGRSISLV